MVSDDDDTEDQNVRIGRKKAAGPMECSVEGCTKKSRGSSGLCRSHGGGEKCVVEGCRGFARCVSWSLNQTQSNLMLVLAIRTAAERVCPVLFHYRLDGRCCMHGGAQMCNVQGCQRVSPPLHSTIEVFLTSPLKGGT